MGSDGDWRVGDTIVHPSGDRAEVLRTYQGLYYYLWRDTKTYVSSQQELEQQGWARKKRH